MAALWRSNGGGRETGSKIRGLSSPAANAPDAVHPHVLFFGRFGGDAVEGVVALHHPPVSVRLARFYHLVFVVRNEELKAVLRVWIRQRIKKCVVFFKVSPGLAGQFTLSPAGGAALTGFLSSTSLTLRFSNGMIPLGSLSWTNTERRAQRR